MKKYLFLLLIPILSFSQNYKIGSVGNYSYDVKIDGSIKVSDNKVIFEYPNKPSIIYDFLKQVNDVVYITDGVMIDFMQIINKQGKKKGFEYDKIIILNFDVRKNLKDIVLFYVKENG